MATEWVRVRDTKNNMDHTVSRVRADQLAARGGVEILTGAKVVDKLGRPLPATPAQTNKSKEQAR